MTFTSLKAIFLDLMVVVFTAWAQYDTGTILGRVSDASNASVPRANVTTREITTNEERTFVTDASGDYRFNALPRGTYQIAVLAREHNVPFYIAAPVSTFDLSIPDGDHIPIEERSSAEVTEFKGIRIAPDVPAAHPAFDVTPNRYIAAIFTERGVARPPYTESLKALAAKAHSFSVV